ncbi:MAG: glycoside hydrolase family 31 protein [Bacillota bacterium]
MNDTSFAIHPGKSRKIENSDYQEAGDVLAIEECRNGLKARTETGELRIVFYANEIVRITMNFFGEADAGTSPAVIGGLQEVKLEHYESGDQAEVKTSCLTVKLTKSPLRITVADAEGRVLAGENQKGMGYKHSKEVICFKNMVESDQFYGFGEKTGFLNKRGEKLVMWNSDVYAPHNPETDPLYQSIPFFLTLREGQAHGIFFDNTFRAEFDMRGDEFYSFSADGGQLDYYLMAGPSPKDVIRQYTSLTGRMPLPAKWAIGYHQSRYSYESQQEVMELAAAFKEKGIPLDSIHLDIHYMDEYRVFTFDRDKFPDPEKMISDLKEMGIHIVPIVDPGVKEDPEYMVYKQGIQEDLFCKYLEGNVYYGDVWPGNSAFPDFTSKKVRDWWGSLHSYYTELGIEGIWNDMNEPAVFNESKTMDLKVMHDNDGNPRTHKELHNLYGLLMGKSTYEGMKRNLKGKRPFLLTRAGYAGVQRYAAVWTGDNRSFWEHLQMSLPMVMNLGVSGIPFSGPDVGGFAHDSNGELLARWTQAGAFTPFFRNHSVLGSARQEPWAFGEKYEAIIRKYIELRYTWMPHLYSLFAEAHKEGTPVMRPLFLEFPEDEHTWNLSDQFMIGDNVIIAPIMQPGTSHRAVYLPEGMWVDYWTGSIYEGEKHHLIKAPLETLPIFISKGTMLAHGEAGAAGPLTLHLYYEEGAECSYTLYEDDGETFAYEEGEYREICFKVKCEKGTVYLHSTGAGNFEPGWSSVQLVVHSREDVRLREGSSTLLPEKIEEGRHYFILS